MTEVSEISSTESDQTEHKQHRRKRRMCPQCGRRLPSDGSSCKACRWKRPIPVAYQMIAVIVLSVIAGLLIVKLQK